MAAVPAPLNFTEIHNYALRFEIEDFDRFLRIIKALDSVYLMQSAKTDKKEIDPA